MIKSTVSSSASEPCVICGKKTSNYYAYNTLGVELQIPVHDGISEGCYEYLDVDKFAELALDLVIAGIRQGGAKI